MTAPKLTKPQMQWLIEVSWDGNNIPPTRTRAILMKRGLIEMPYTSYCELTDAGRDVLAGRVRDIGGGK